MYPPYFKKFINLNYFLSHNNVSKIKKVDFFITAQEENGYNYSEPFYTQGKLLSSVSSFNEEGEFTFSMEASEIASLFSGEFTTKPRPQTAFIGGDLFELHWVISG